MTTSLALNELTDTNFKPFVNKLFTAIQEDSLSFELLEVSPLGSVPQSDQRQPFSLVFRGPNTDTPAQKVYLLQLAELGQMELFLVPIGPDATGMLYEAVFT